MVIIYSLWRSIYTGQVYEMPKDHTPKFGGYEFIGYIAREK